MRIYKKDTREKRGIAVKIKSPIRDETFLFIAKNRFANFSRKDNMFRKKKVTLRFPWWVYNRFYKTQTL